MLHKNNGMKKSLIFLTFLQKVYIIFRKSFIYYDIKMVRKIETSQTVDRKSEVINATKQELSDLNLSIWPGKDKEKFDKLSKDPSLKRGLEKILKKWLKHRIKSFEEVNNKYTQQKVDEYTADMIKSHPELISFIWWELGLPIKTGETEAQYNFSKLTFEQKLSFLALYETKYDFWNNFNKAWTNEIINKYKSWMKKFVDEATEDLNKNVESKKVLGLVNIEKLLKNDYWLTDTEYKKMEEYLKLIQNHPEYVWWDIKPVEAGWFWIWLGIGILVWLLIAALWYISYEKIFKLKEPETRVYWDHTEIQNFKEVFKVMSAQAEASSNRRQFEEEGFGHFDETTWNWVERAAKRTWNRAIDVVNWAQSRKLDLEVNTEMGYFFDFEGTTCNVEIKDWKWIFHVKTKKPEVKIISTDAKIYKSKREWINLDKFDDFELRAVNTLKEEALEEAKKPENLKKAEESLRKDMLNMFRITWFANSQMVVKAEDVQDVIIEYEN